jgi:hypothetical protein
MLINGDIKRIQFGMRVHGVSTRLIGLKVLGADKLVIRE